MKFIKKGFWRTKEKVLVAIKDMDNDHLANTLRMLKRYGEVRLDHTQRAYLLCPAPTADMAELLFDQEFEYWTTEATWLDALGEHSLKFDKLLEEAENRRLPVVAELIMMGVNNG